MELFHALCVPTCSPPGWGLPFSHPKLLSPYGQLTWSGLVWVVAQMASCPPNIYSPCCLSRRLQFYSGVPSQQAPYFLAFLADHNGEWAAQRHVTWGIGASPSCLEQVAVDNSLLLLSPSASWWEYGCDSGGSRVLLKAILMKTTLQRLVEEKEP